MKNLWTWLVELDQILRGEKTRVSDLRNREIAFSLGGVTLVLVILGMFYGICMGCYAVINHGRGIQMFASMLKVPALFLLTLVVTLPSLYVFNAIVGSKLTVSSLVRLFVAALGVNLAVLASLGPIVAFFSINTTTYNFMVLLNVAVFTLAGLLGLAFLLQTLHRLNIAPRRPSQAPPAIPIEPLERSGATDESADEPEPSPILPAEGHVLGRHTKTVFACWIFVYGLVGAQMGWVLRPFIGAPTKEFEWFRARSSNFFEAVWHSLLAIFR